MRERLGPSRPCASMLRKRERAVEVVSGGGGVRVGVK